MLLSLWYRVCLCGWERERRWIFFHLFDSLSWMRLKSPRTGSASKLARVLHLQLFFATCKPPACHASKLTLPFVWSPVSKRLLSPDCQSELSSTPASQELWHAADSAAAAEIKLSQSMRLREREGNVLLFICECVCFVTELREGMLWSSLVCIFMTCWALVLTWMARFKFSLQLFQTTFPIFPQSLSTQDGHVQSTGRFSKLEKSVSEFFK